MICYREFLDQESNLGPYVQTDNGQKLIYF